MRPECIGAGLHAEEPAPGSAPRWAPAVRRRIDRGTAGALESPVEGRTRPGRHGPTCRSRDTSPSAGAPSQPARAPSPRRSSPLPDHRRRTRRECWNRLQPVHALTTGPTSGGDAHRRSDRSGKTLCAVAVGGHRSPRRTGRECVSRLQPVRALTRHLGAATRGGGVRVAARGADSPSTSPTASTGGPGGIGRGCARQREALRDNGFREHGPLVVDVRSMECGSARAGHRAHRAPVSRVPAHGPRERFVSRTS
ncbi:hypothetical protein HNR68_001413 [Saccharopolyspora hordei]|uniref:Uncharacterized protein n=1 Tax=Saccharopolyspora hordei TaxID=1838 RepID=A0A853AKL1_9PSEU|nr:hypothetical protein [Saccharopolyspora hordei]